jgi:hypothetical protein
LGWNLVLGSFKGFVGDVNWIFEAFYRWKLQRRLYFNIIWAADVNLAYSDCLKQFRLSWRCQIPVWNVILIPPRSQSYSISQAALQNSLTLFEEYWNTKLVLQTASNP